MGGRTLRFLAGAACGMAAAGVLAAACAGVWLAASGKLFNAAGDRVDIAGADVSLAGGARVVVKQTARTLSLTCRDVCDDVTLLGQGKVESVRVTGSDGHAVVSRKADLFGAPAHRAWTVSGRPNLSIERKRP